jgi:integrase
MESQILHDSERQAIDWVDWANWMLAEDGKAPATVHEMKRAARHMTKVGLDWQAFARGADQAVKAARPFLAAKVASSHRHAVQKYMRVLNLVARYLARDEISFRSWECERNTCRVRGLHWHYLRVPEGRLEPYALAELDKLHQYRHPNRFVEARRRALLWMAENTGLRRSELGRIQLEDLDEATSSMLVRPAKEGKERRIPLPLDAWSPKRPLQAWIHMHPKGRGGLWMSSAGRELGLNMMSREFWDIRVESGVELNFNRFRHTRATDLLERGVRVELIQDLYGHASIDSTLHYARRTPKTISHELEKCRVPGFAALSRSKKRKQPMEPVQVHSETPEETGRGIETAA